MTSTLDCPRRRPPQAASGRAKRPEDRQRALRLLATELDFVPNQAFRCADAEQLFAAAAQAAESAPAGLARRPARSLPPHLARLCATAPLNPDQEREQFRRMNYVKFRFNALRATLDPDHIDAETLARAERLLAEAVSLRDQLVRANLRLAVAVVKKFVTPYFSFDELLSDGMLTLMHAVDKFDYDRGFRFSTYAYRCLTRNVYRTIVNRRKECSRCVSNSDEIDHLPGADGNSALDERTWERLRTRLSRLVKRLDRREQFIIARRYALDQERSAQTFQSLADEMGLSKERVRQLELRAVSKLREMVDRLPQDECLEG